MANIKSAKKRIRVTKTKTERNKQSRSLVKMFFKKIESLVKSGDKAEAQKTLIEATKTIAKAQKKGIYHKNNAARKIGRLQKKVNKA